MTTAQGLLVGNSAASRPEQGFWMPSSERLKCLQGLPEGMINLVELEQRFWFYQQILTPALQPLRS